MRQLSLAELKAMPLWSTRLRVVIEHTHIDNEYTVTYEGVLGSMSRGASEFGVCIGGKGYSGEGRWLSILHGPLSSTKVTVYEI